VVGGAVIFVDLRRFAIAASIGGVRDVPMGLAL
jgi:hypothetical protein